MIFIRFCTSTNSPTSSSIFDSSNMASEHSQTSGSDTQAAGTANADLDILPDALCSPRVGHEICPQQPLHASVRMSGAAHISSEVVYRQKWLQMSLIKSVGPTCFQSPVTCGLCSSIRSSSVVWCGAGIAMRRVGSCPGIAVSGPPGCPVPTAMESKSLPVSGRPDGLHLYRFEFK